MFSVNDKIYYYLEAKRKHYPGIILAISPTDYVIKYFDELGAYHIVKDVQEQLLEHRKEEAGDQVNNPKHYNAGQIEVIDAIEDWKLNFNLGNAIKYIARCNHKGNKQQDIKKAIWYLERELKHE